MRDGGGGKSRHRHRLVKMARSGAEAGGRPTLDPTDANYKTKMNEFLGMKGAEIVADATGVPDAIPTAMSLACDRGSRRRRQSAGKAKEVNFYDDLHRRYIEVTGATGNQLFEPAHTRLAGAWDINKAQKWLRRVGKRAFELERADHPSHQARGTGHGV